MFKKFARYMNRSVRKGGIGLDETCGCLKKAIIMVALVCSKEMLWISCPHSPQLHMYKTTTQYGILVHAILNSEVEEQGRHPRSCGILPLITSKGKRVVFLMMIK